MAAITISRQLGSRGTAMACEVAGRLRFRLVRRELINEAARQAGAPEMALAAIDDLGLFDLHPPEDVCRAYRSAVAEMMNRLVAQEDVVIVGRAGQVILGGRSDVLHVRIIAPAGVRAARIAAQQGIPAGAAHARIEQSDRTRREYLRCAYDVDWNDPALYDLVLNTERIAVQRGANLIGQALTALASPTSYD